jgi:ubiquinone/menaquinone biosynthesis C-methylase UbiE
MSPDFSKRSLQLERIDTGEYTPEEYETFLREIRIINRLIGDARALKRTLLKEISTTQTDAFSVLDVGAGSGELLRVSAEFARRNKLSASLFGLDLNEQSAVAVRAESGKYPEINSIRGDAFSLPFADKSFDFAFSSLFTHHFPDEQIVDILREMSRVARRGVFVVDLHRHPVAYRLYRMFCTVAKISPLVREDGSLSVLRSFVPSELEELGRKAGLKGISVARISPFRLVLRSG